MTTIDDYAAEPNDHPGGGEPDEPDAGRDDEGREQAEPDTVGDPGSEGEDDTGDETPAP